MEVTMIKCNKCAVLLPIDNFPLKRNGTRKKLCNHCRMYYRMYRQHNRCQHRRYKYDCKICNSHQPVVFDNDLKTNVN